MAENVLHVENMTMQFGGVVLLLLSPVLQVLSRLYL